MRIRVVKKKSRDESIDIGDAIEEYKKTVTVVVKKADSEQDEKDKPVKIKKIQEFETYKPFEKFAKDWLKNNK